jgi:hypothetical protein
MKRITKLTWMLLLTLLMIRCNKDDEVVPVTPLPDKEPIVIDTVGLSGSSFQSEKFSVIGETSNETSAGFDVKGALYLETDSGKVKIVDNAAFTLVNDANGLLSTIKGTGPAQLPDVGMFSSFDISKASEAYFEFNTGKFFKDNNEDFQSLPLRDTSYYFYYNLLNLVPGQKAEMKVKNAKLGVSSFFINLPQQELIITTGSFGINTPAGEISVGSDLAIGISAKKAFQFTPHQYADSALNAVINQQKAFSDISGFLYLAGEMSLGNKIPMKIDGNAIIDGDMDIIFSEGFVSTSYIFGLNGNLIFGHDLLDLIPLDFETKLTSVTMKLEQHKNGNESKEVFKFAGEFDDNAWMETIVDAIAGTNISQYVPFTGNEGNMFASFGEDWEFYVNTYFAFNTPHLGKQPTRRGTLHITSSQLGIWGGMAIPFVPGDVAAKGIFGYDGKIHLEAKAKTELKIKDFSLNADLDFDIYNDSSTLTGNVNVPYDLGKVNVAGKIDSKGLSFSGNAGNKNIGFGNNLIMPVGNLKISANIREVNPGLSITGIMAIPQLDVQIVNVSGTIDKRGLEFNGTLNTNVRLQKYSAPLDLPFANATLVARTWEGVRFYGNMQMPYGIGNATIEGQVNGNKKDLGGFPELFFTAKFSSDPVIKIEGFSFPTTNLYLSASTVDGIKFDGKVKLGDYFGYLASTGIISGSKIDFTASYKQNLNFGSRSMYSNLNIYAGNNRYPNIASLSGEVHSPFGKVNVSGVIGLNGKFAFSGAIDGCGTASNPFKTFSAQYSKNFAFSQTGVSLSASASLCDNACGESKSCTGVSASTDIDWDKGTFKVCVPIPVIGSICF